MDLAKAVIVGPIRYKNVIDQPDGVETGLLSMAWQFGRLRSANLCQARRMIAPNHTAKHQDDSQDEKNMNEPAHRIGRYQAGDPQPHKEKSNQKHFIIPF